MGLHTHTHTHWCTYIQKTCYLWIASISAPEWKTHTTLYTTYTHSQKYTVFSFPVSFGLGWITLYALPEHIYVECIHPVVWIHMSANRFTFILCTRSNSSPGHMWLVHCRYLDKIWMYIFMCSCCVLCSLYPHCVLVSYLHISFPYILPFPIHCKYLILFHLPLPCFSLPIFISVLLYSVAFYTLFLWGYVNLFVPSNLSFYLPF